MRSNLLSLQNIAGQVDLTQNRLSTGLKVNSAIDNPSSYYTAVSLNNRASDLSALLDSMAQGIQTIKAATEGLEAGAGLLEQAAATATQALETTIPAKSWFEQQEGVAAVVSSKEELLAALDSGKKGDIVIYGQIDMGDSGIVLKEGQNLTGIGAYGVADNERGKFSALNFRAETLSLGIYAAHDQAKISDLSVSFDASYLKYSRAIYMKGNDVLINNLDLRLDATDYPDPGYEAETFSGLYLAGQATLSGNNTIVDQTSQHLDAQRIYGISLIENANVTLTDGAVLNIKTQTRAGFGISGSKNNVFTVNNAQVNIQTTGAAGYAFHFIELDMLGEASLNYSGMAPIFNATKLDLQSNLVQLNLQSSKQLFSNDGGTSTIKAVAGAEINFNGRVQRAVKSITEAYAPKISASDLNEASDGTIWDYWSTAQEAALDLKLDDLFVDEAPKEKRNDRYLTLLTQYDSLIKDSSYKGINLLREQDLTVTFNENRSAQLTVKGKDASTKALGLNVIDWATQSDIAQSLAEISGALNQIRQMTSEFGNYYSIITTRENFTQNLINVLTEGADKLTLADMNEESANMLALQTRQQLAVNSLSLASQASQSILKLF